MRILTYSAILVAMWCPSGAFAAPHFIPDCAGNTEIANAHVARVEKNGALVLGDGRAVVLEGIRLPGTDRAPESLAGLALSRLREMAMAGPVTFTTIPPRQDRYQRVRAQAFGTARDARQSNQTSWFQVALLEQGLARVAISPDRDECAPDLYEAEQRGREKHAGIWALSANAPRTPEAMKGTGGSFQIVDGRVTNIGKNGGRVFIDFGSNGQRVFSAVIQPEDRHAFRDFDLDGLEAHRVRIRGLVQDYRGRPQIALSNPAQIEVLN
jgi:endonuclease YncB( thermonuclease family)